MVGVMIIMLIWVLFPFYWAFLNSIKKPAETFPADLDTVAAVSADAGALDFGAVYPRSAATR